MSADADKPTLHEINVHFFVCLRQQWHYMELLSACCEKV